MSHVCHSTSLLEFETPLKTTVWGGKGIQRETESIVYRSGGEGVNSQRVEGWKGARPGGGGFLVSFRSCDVAHASAWIASALPGAWPSPAAGRRPGWSAETAPKWACATFLSRTAGALRRDSSRAGPAYRYSPTTTIKTEKAGNSSSAFFSPLGSWPAIPPMSGELTTNPSHPAVRAMPVAVATA
jgi:hypothetical protein